MAKANSEMITGHWGCGYTPKFMQIKLNENFLSRENSKGEASFRILYYGGAAGAVPFTWESQPGTPKQSISDAPLPPLTPPPSYQFSPQMKSMHKVSKSNVFHSVFGSKKMDISSSPSSSSCSSSYSLPSTPMNRLFTKRHSRSAPCPGLEEDTVDEGGNSPISKLCFGTGSGSLWGSGSYSRMKTVKKAFLSILPDHGKPWKKSVPMSYFLTSRGEIQTFTCYLLASSIFNRWCVICPLLWRARFVKFLKIKSHF